MVWATRPGNYSVMLDASAKTLVPNMNAVVAANLVGITGIARRLVQDGEPEELAARDAMAKAAAAKQPLPQYFAEKKLVTPGPTGRASLGECSKWALRLQGPFLFRRWVCRREADSMRGQQP